MNPSIKNFYFKNQEIYSSELNDVSNLLKRMVLYRLISFILIFVPASLIGIQSLFTLFLTFSAIVLFFFLVKKNIQLEKKKQKILILLNLVKNELLALDHSFSYFESGKEFLDSDHFFSYDLDLFGDGSLFQFINRTSTSSGREKLANWFIRPELQNEKIEKTQEAIRELAQNPEWRLQFLANGLLFEETKEMNHEIKNWSSRKLTLKSPVGTKWLINIIPALTLISILPAITGFSNLFVFFMVFLQWTLLGFFGKRIREYFLLFGRKSNLLEKYMALLNLIEEKDFNGEYLIGLQKQVIQPISASKIFGELKKRVKEFEYRGNIIVGFFLNSIFLWDIRCVYKLWNWHSKNHSKLASWLEVISETDALISLANYACNHPEYVYPEVKNEGFIFSAKELGHPLLHPDKRICNDLKIEGWSKVEIITGANMAGKSTFLRTVGVNLILGRLGVPVCAKKMIFTPVKIYTNMRTTDSLLKDESYFFAELKRIKGVLDRLQKGERIFIILDEMLKGTNSIDKLSGSKELIKKLIEFESVSLIATHDLKLSEMEKEFPRQVSNHCFEIRIKNDELIFDYKLTDGVTQTMNATFLMKKMGII